MGVLDIFRRRSASAKVAKERLQIIVAHQRNGRRSRQNEEPLFMEEMKREILEVVRKYVAVAPENVEASIGKDGNTDVLALNINLSERDGEQVQAPSEEPPSAKPDTSDER